MKDIKTRENKKDIKMLDRAAGLAKVTKDATVRTKDQIQNLSDDGQITPDEYAENKVKNTVCFFGYREIYNLFELEEKLEEHIRILLESKEYVEFLVGRNGEFDQLVSSTVRRVKRNFRDDNSALVLVLPYLTAEYENNHQSFHEYYDEIEICQDAAGGHYKAAIQVRNREMVDRSDLVVCCIEHNSGGAFRTVQYAKKKNKEIVNLSDQ